MMNPRWTAVRQLRVAPQRVAAAIVGVAAALLCAGLHPALASADELVRPGPSKLTIKPRVTVAGRSATVADVLWLREADTRVTAEIGGMTLAESTSGTSTTITMSHDQIAARLEQLGVNPSRVTIGGALECKITFQCAAPASPPPATPAPIATIESADERNAAKRPAIVETNVAAAPTASILREAPSPTGGRTLAAVIRDVVRAEFGERVAGIEIEFERAGQEYLDLTTPPFTFDIRAGNDRERLGIRELSVVVRRDGKNVRTVRLGANVRATRQVAVATRPLNVGTYLKRDDVRLEERLFDGSQDWGLAQLDALVGQQAVRFVAPGEMLQTKDVKSVDLVTRSAPVTITGDGGPIQLRASGIALDSGGYGDIVRVRLGDNRKDRREIRALVTAVGTVRVVDDATATTAARPSAASGPPRPSAAALAPPRPAVGNDDRRNAPAR